MLKFCNWIAGIFGYRLMKTWPSGGSGAAVTASATPVTGRDGGSGIVIIEEFYA